jgi:hypothetical protein
MIGRPLQGPDTPDRAIPPNVPNTPSPCHPLPLFPLPREREEGEGSWGEGFCRDYGSPGNAYSQVVWCAIVRCKRDHAAPRLRTLIATFPEPRARAEPPQH